MYVTYNYYVAEFGGGLSEAEFIRAEREAEAMIRYFTYVNGDIFADESEAVKNAVCTAAETIAKSRAAESSGESRIKSESNDGYSVTYMTETKDGETSEEALRRKVYQSIRFYLMPTGWLNRSLGHCGRRH